MTRMVRKLVAVPVAVVSAVALAVAGGGFALAATQGVLDVPFTEHDNRSDKAPAAPESINPGLTHATNAPSSPGAPEGTPSASPSPSLSGLCVAVQAGAAEVNKANPAFAALTAAAGSAEDIAAYCTALVGDRPVRPAKPTQAASPTISPKPTQAASPTIPPKPTQAAEPTIPPKPEQAVQPTVPPKPQTP